MNRQQIVGGAWKDTRGAIFTGWYGEALTTNTPNTWLYRLIAKHPDHLHQVSIHSFRHLFISSMLESGRYSIGAIASMVGDTRATITSTYCHSIKKAEISLVPPALDLPFFNGEKDEKGTDDDEKGTD